MIIGNSNLLINKNILNQNQIIKNNNINQNKPTPEEKEKERIKMLSHQLKGSRITQEKIQNTMFYLEKKEVDLFNIQDIGEKLKSLSDKYSNSKLSDEEKDLIKDEANELLKQLELIMNGDPLNGKNNMSEKIMHFDMSSGEKVIVTSSEFKINLSDVKIEEGKILEEDKKKNFKKNINTEDLLKSSSVIEKRIIEPVKEAIEEVYSDKSYVYNKFLEEYEIAMNSIDELFKLGEISEYMKDTLLKFQEGMFKNVIGIRFQSKDLDRNSVLELLK